MDKKKVKEALEIVRKALEDEEFLNWLEQKNDLDHEYSVSRTEAFDFYTWALWRYVFDD